MGNDSPEPGKVMMIVRTSYSSSKRGIFSKRANDG
jgi:hypothetical protein